MFHTCLTVNCRPEESEMLMAGISALGFDGFLETETGFQAFATEEKFDHGALVLLLIEHNLQQGPGYSFSRVDERNWNSEWEKNFEPIQVENKCYIRAIFHEPRPEYPLELIITPSMAFGTGHHATTYLMVKNQMDTDHRRKTVMDAGCGTGILSILASKLGAASVEAFDNDPVCVGNALENAAQNSCDNITVREGMIQDLLFQNDFDLVLANITRNVLKKDLPQYKSYLKPGGRIIISGFYEEDIPEMLHEANRLGLRHVHQEVRDRWAVIILMAN